MSGGSMDYLYAKVLDAEFSTHGNPLRKAFKEHLEKVAKALHDIEWVDSCDKAKGEDEEAILACISVESVLQFAIKDAKQTAQRTQETLEIWIARAEAAQAALSEGSQK